MENQTRYGLEDRPRLASMLLYGLQWWIIALPSIVILGLIGSGLQGDDLGRQIFYLQKLFWLMGLTTVLQVCLGHRLPVIEGPAAILLVGLTATVAVGVEAAYSALMIGGALMALLAASGLMSIIRAAFTPRMIAVILVLIAVALAPSINPIS